MEDHQENGCRYIENSIEKWLFYHVITNHEYTIFDLITNLDWDQRMAHLCV